MAQVVDRKAQMVGVKFRAAKKRRMEYKVPAIGAIQIQQRQRLALYKFDSTNMNWRYTKFDSASHWRYTNSTAPATGAIQIRQHLGAIILYGFISSGPLRHFSIICEPVTVIVTTILKAIPTFTLLRCLAGQYLTFLLGIARSQQPDFHRNLP